MDYDATNIAVTYDCGRNHGPEILDLWMNLISSYVNSLAVTNILDLGCGTGRFTESLAAQFNANVIGIDPSIKMLEQAQKKQSDSRACYQVGCGEAIPLPDNSVDMVFMSMVFHHLTDPTLVARECRRVLRTEGTIFLRAGTLERIASYPYVEFFPTSKKLLEQCLPAGRLVKETFEGAGFRTIDFKIVTQQIATDLECYAEKLSVGADSILASLPQSDFEAGIKAMRSQATRSNNQSVFEPIDVFVFR